MLVATLSLLALAGTALGADGQPPPFPNLPGNWTQITINRKIGGVWHTVILDRGRIVQVSATRMTLLESDGTLVPIPLVPQTIVQPLPLGLTVYDLRRGLNVDAMRIDTGAAVRVRIRGKVLKIVHRLRAAP